MEKAREGSAAETHKPLARATEEEDGENDALHKICSRLWCPLSPLPVNGHRLYPSLQVVAFSPSPLLLLPGSKCKSHLARRNNADLIPRLRAWMELKKQSAAAQLYVRQLRGWDQALDHTGTSRCHSVMTAPASQQWWCAWHGGDGDGCFAVFSRFGEI